MHLRHDDDHITRRDRFAVRAVDFAHTIVEAGVGSRGRVVLVADREAFAVRDRDGVRRDARPESAGERVGHRGGEEIPRCDVHRVVATRRGGEGVPHRLVRGEVVVRGGTRRFAVTPAVAGQEIDVPVRHRVVVVQPHELLGAAARVHERRGEAGHDRPVGHPRAAHRSDDVGGLRVEHGRETRGQSFDEPLVDLVGAADPVVRTGRVVVVDLHVEWPPRRRTAIQGPAGERPSRAEPLFRRG